MSTSLHLPRISLLTRGAIQNKGDNTNFRSLKIAWPCVMNALQDLLFFPIREQPTLFSFHMGTVRLSFLSDKRSYDLANYCTVFPHFHPYHRSDLAASQVNQCQCKIDNQLRKGIFFGGYMKIQTLLEDSPKTGHA